MIPQYKKPKKINKFSFLQDIEAREIDVGFINQEFIESYNKITNIKDDHFTVDDTDIITCLQKIEDEEIDDRIIIIRAINDLSTLIHHSPDQVMRNMYPEHMHILLQFMLCNETQYDVLYLLCYVFQLIIDSPDFIQILIEFDFYSQLREIMCNTEEIVIINLCLFLLVHSFQIRPDYMNIIFDSKILESVMSLETKDKIVDELISRVFEKVFSITDNNYINYIYQTYIDFLLKKAFYSQTEKAKFYALNGLLNLFQNFPDTTLILENNHAINILTENLIDKNQKIRICSSHILYQCITASKFPLFKFYEYKSINTMLSRFDWNDEELHISCIENIKELIHKADDQFMQQIIKEINNTDFFSNLVPLSFAVKEELVPLFIDLFDKIDGEQIESIFTDDFLDFLFDLLPHIKSANQISSIFIKILDKVTDEQFRFNLIEAFNSTDALQMLEDLVLEEDIKENERNNINQLIKIIKDNQPPLVLDDLI